MNSNYEKVQVEQWRKNMKETKILANTEDSFLLEKACNWLSDRGLSKELSPEEMVDKAKNGDILALGILAPNPLRQNITEKYFKNYLKTWSFVVEVEKPSKILKNKGSLYVIDGNEEWLNNRRDKNIKVKSVDFVVKLKNNKLVYLFHKYIKVGGGSQDNQENDIREWLENVKNFKKGHCIAVCDGSYFDEKTMINLKKYEINLVKVTNTEGLYVFLKQISE